MRMDMMSGKLPDIINLAGLQSTSINCSEYLTDLSPYLKQTFGEDLSDIQTTVIEALMEDGQLFSITPNFNLSVLCSLDRLQEEKLTTDKFCELIETSKSKDLVSNMTVLRVLLENSLDDVIHLETKTVDTDQLQKFLEFAAAFPSTANGDNTTVQESLLNGDIVFAQAELSSLRDFRFMLTELGENIQIYGYPSPSGDSVVLEASNYLAISKSSKNPEAAWLFISSMMEPELQQQFSHRVFPIRKSCLEEQIEEAKQSESGFSDTAEALLEQMFDRIGRQSVLDESAVQIIYEVAEAFFAGDTSLDSTIDVIDSRLSIYLSEQD